MSSYDYDYSPLSTGLNASPKKSSRLWRTGCTVLLSIDLLLLLVYTIHAWTSPSSNTLDDFQQLNNISAVNWMAAPAVPSHSTTLDPDDHAVVSSLYSDEYIRPITTLGHSLKSVNVTARMILLHIPGQLSSRTLCLATAAGWTLHPVTLIPPPHNGNGVSYHYKDQYTKLNLWTLDSLGIKSLVYLDADTLVRKNFDELFTLPFNFAAVPDVFSDNRGFTIGFNAGVLFVRPSTVIFEDMLSKLEAAVYSPTFAEQAFLNVYFGSQAARLPYAYNANLAIKIRSPKLWETMLDDMRIVHYTLAKPFPEDDNLTLEEFFEGRRTMKHGLWEEEMIWWQDTWGEMTTVMLEPTLQCS